MTQTNATQIGTPAVDVDEIVVDDTDVTHHIEDSEPGAQAGEEVTYDLGEDGV
jgi:hypothetical protein